MSTSAGTRLREQYWTLTLVERVNLILTAQDQNDPDELQALENTCYKEERRRVSRRLLRLSCAASAVAIQLLTIELLVVKRFEDLLNAAPAAAPDQPGENASASPNPTPELSDTHALWARVAGDDKLAVLLEEAAAIWLGFCRWCWEIGHDPHQVLRQAAMGSTEADLSYTILRDQIEYSERWAGDLVPDPDHINAFHQLLAHAFWSIGR